MSDLNQALRYLAIIERNGWEGENLLNTAITLRDALAQQYNAGWNDATTFAAEQAKARLSRKARPTSREAVARNADSIKGVQLAVYGLISKHPLGMTDFDLEDALGRSHQSVSAARNALMMAGLVTDSGKRRPNRRGNNVTVWVATSPSSEETSVPVSDSPVPVPVDPVGDYSLLKHLPPAPPLADAYDGGDALADYDDSPEWTLG
jgi:hypothetical protein